MPLLWSKAHTTVSYKIVENFCGLALTIKHASNCIPERYVSVWEDHGGSTNELPKWDIYSPVSWLCDKSEEININLSSGNKIFGNDNKFKRNDFIIAETKNGKYKGDVLRLSRPTKQQYCS